jgi:hypothetical protein
MGSRKEFQPKLVLQIRHGLTDRGLSNMQPPRCLPVPFALDYRGEIAQMSQFHLIGTPYQSDWNIRRIAMSLPKSTYVRRFGFCRPAME